MTSNVKTFGLKKFIIILTLVISIIAAAVCLYINYETVVKELPFFKKDIVEQTIPNISPPELTQPSEPILQKEENIPLQEQEDNKKNIYDTQIALYRHYLLEVTMLLSNFLQDKPIISELMKIKTLEMPKEIEDILSELEEYDTKFLGLNDKEKIFPPLKLLETFIKIEKNSESSKQKKALQEHIKNNLAIIINYFYSDDFKKVFFNEN